MIVDKLEQFYRERAESGPRNPFRASRAGHCERAMGYDKLGIPGDPITPRRAAVFRHGIILDGALKADLQAVLGDKFINFDDLPYNECEIEGVKVGFLPDGGFQTDTGEIGIVEVKTMAEYSFDRALKGEIDRTYLCQAWMYHYGTSFNPIVFVCYKKNTSHFCEVIFDRNADASVITQRFGGDAKELYINDPLLVAEICTPFDASVEEEVRGKFRRLSLLNSESELADGVRAIETEVVKVQGAANAEAYTNNHPGAKNIGKSGSWFSFETGRRIAKFPCSYCAHVKRCLGAQLEFTDSNAPLWVC